MHIPAEGMHKTVFRVKSSPDANNGAEKLARLPRPLQSLDV